MTEQEFAGARAAILSRLQFLLALKNPWAAAFVKYAGLPQTLKFRGGLTILCTKRDWDAARTLVGIAACGALLSGEEHASPVAWFVDWDHRRIRTPSGLWFSLASMDYLILAETFIYDVHFVDFDLTGRTILDVGANVGDTALYFAAKGAQVIALEPDPENFEQLLHNLSLNPGLLGRIRPFNIALGRDGETRFIGGRGGDSGTEGRGGRPMAVRSMSLRSILELSSLRRMNVLKMDCKGCEAQVVEQPEMRCFDRVMIEYLSNGEGVALNLIIERLKVAGFRWIRVYAQNALTTDLRFQGMIDAVM